MKKDAVFLRHILETIEKIENSTKDVTKEEFESDVDVQDSTLRRVEIIGEAVKNISEKTKAAYPEVEWKKIAGTRDILIHAYFSVDPEVVYGIIEKDLQPLKSRIAKILAKFEKGTSQ